MKFSSNRFKIRWNCDASDERTTGVVSRCQRKSFETSAHRQTSCNRSANVIALMKNEASHSTLLRHLCKIECFTG